MTKTKLDNEDGYRYTITYTGTGSNNESVGGIVGRTNDPGADLQNYIEYCNNNGVVTFTEKSGHYGVGAPVIDDSDLTTGVVAEATTTKGVTPSSPITVTATSVFNDEASDTATITIA